MNRKQLFKNLNKLCLDLDCLYNINCGGCCFVAAVLAEQFENYNIPFTVIKYDICGLHYAIRVQDRIINRCDFSYKEIVFDKILNSDKLYSHYYSKNYWNSLYNRKWNLIVKTKIKSLFKKYENRRKRLCNGRCIS